MKLIDAHQMWNYAHSEIERANKRHENDPEFKQWSSNIADLIDALAQDMPTVEAEPVKHAKWRLETDEEMPNPMFKLVVCCSCNDKANDTYKYCPNCGAKMDAKE